MIYFDNAATTKPCEASVAAAVQAMREYGNPSSLHKMGLQAQLLVDAARESLAKALCCMPEEIIFTSCATESSNTALASAVRLYGKRKKKLIISAVEHPSVAEPAARLEQDGYTVVRIAPDEQGRLLPEAFAEAVDEDTFLVSCMAVNNETGADFPVREIFAAVKRKNSEVLTHCDAVQAFCKQPLDTRKLGADLLSVSGHKIYAPKGIGALYVKKGVRIAPLLLGGGQEKSRRSGTENVPLICAFGAAVREFTDHTKERTATVAELNSYLRQGLASAAGVELLSPVDATPYIISISVAGYKSETLLHFLESEGVCVSSGSACSRGKKSTVLGAFGFSPAQVDSALRISLSHENTKQEADKLLEALSAARVRLCKVK